MSKRVTQERVQEIFREIVKRGEMPTASKIESTLGIQYKSSTVFKYLQALKIRAYRKFIKWEEKTLEFEEEQGSATDNEVVIYKEMTEKLAHLQELNKILSAELARVEKEAIQLREKNLNLQREFEDIQQQNQHLSLKVQFLEKFCEEIKEERAMMAEAIAKEKNQQIEALQQELKSIHREHLETVQKIGFESDDALIREKVKAINLEDNVTHLTQTVGTLERELKKEREVHQPLTQRLNKQQAFIERMMNWEQLQEYERLLKEN